jgi:hypothetical protein
VESWIAANKGPGRKSERAIAPLLGISQASLNEIRNKKGPLGLHVLLALRTAMRMSIDELLGLPSLMQTVNLPKAALSPEELDDIRELLKKEQLKPRQSRPPRDPWKPVEKRR